MCVCAAAKTGWTRPCKRGAWATSPTTTPPSSSTHKPDATAACKTLNGTTLLGSKALMVRYATNTRADDMSDDDNNDDNDSDMHGSDGIEDDEFDADDFF